jgi:hypothetical protein
MMKRVKMTAAACAMAMFALFTGAAAQDFNTNERTYLTFSGTVELPNTTLQPGTYLFRLADSQSNRHIVQVFNQDESQILATILAVPAERLEVTGENVVTFRETAEGGTPAVQYWYYPGDRIGHEFVYPRQQAERIAKRTGQNVLTADGDVASADTTVSSVGPDGQVTEWERENAPAQTAESQAGTVEGTAGMSQQPAGEPQTAQASPETVNPAEESQNPESETPPAEPMTAQSQPAQPSEMTQPEPPAQPAPAEQAQAEQPEPEPQQPEEAAAVGTAGQEPAAAQQPAELPRTASPLPLSGLIGLFSLGGALALRRMRK